MATPTAKIFDFNSENGFITIFIDGEQHTIRANASNFEKAKSFFIASDWDSLLFEMNPSLRFKSLYAKYEAVEVKDGQVFVNGDSIHEVDARRILGFMSEGADCVPIFKFITRLQNNPSKRAVDELYKFLEHKNLPLTDSGTFLAYKAVRDDFTDKHTGKFFNGVGEVLEMPRNKVDDNKEVGCSYGFHAGTLEYASNFAGGNDRLVLVEIDPADVVSIPTDCEFQKLRTCRYKVVAEYERPLVEHVYESRFSTEHDDDVDNEWDDDNPTCCECGEESYGNCEGCDCCEGCCDCSDDDEELEDAYEPKTEVQLSLNLDNKMQSIPWYEVKVNIDTLLNHLFKSRRPALAMAIRRDNKEFNFDEMPFGSLRNYTTNDDARNIFNELNP